MHIRHAARGILALAACVLLSAPAHAQLFRAYLSINGSDANPCTVQAPCRLLPTALNAVASGGEIWMLDSANYNGATVNITKSVTILAVPGAVGSVVATGGDAILINTGGVNVVLRNLVIVPLPGGGGVNGVTLAAGSSLVVENCLIANMASNGLNIQPSNSTNVRIAGSTIRGNGSNGIVVIPNAATTTTTFDVIDTNIDGNGVGMYVDSSNATANIKGAVRNSRVSQGSGNGLTVNSSSGSAVTVTVSHASITNNAATGIVASFTPAKVWVAGSTITGNTGAGLSASSGGVIESASNNEVRNNDAGNAFNVTTPGMM